MKKVINRRMYNTDTAECVAEWGNDFCINEFQ